MLIDFVAPQLEKEIVCVCVCPASVLRSWKTDNIQYASRSIGKKNGLSRCLRHLDWKVNIFSILINEEVFFGEWMTSPWMVLPSQPRLWTCGDWSCQWSWFGASSLWSGCVPIGIDFWILDFVLIWILQKTTVVAPDMKRSNGQADTGRRIEWSFANCEC